MHINDGYIAGVMPVYPRGTNSTMFTECCAVAICDDEPLCPECKRKVIGYDEPKSVRGKIRWKYASRSWKK